WAGTESPRLAAASGAVCGTANLGAGAGDAGSMSATGGGAGTSGVTSAGRSARLDAPSAGGIVTLRSSSAPPTSLGGASGDGLPPGAASPDADAPGEPASP